MTQAQKNAKEKFKKAIAYRTKTGVSLKEAFAHIYGKKVSAVKKKTAPKKKAAPKNKAASKKIGALPNSFKGAIMDIGFKVYHQYDIYGDVTSIIEDNESGNIIVKVNGKGTAKDKAEAFYNYINKYSGFDKKDYAPSLKTKLNKFVSNLHQEVKDFNAGRKKTIKQMPIKIAEPKKSVLKLNPVKSKKLTKKKSEVKQSGNTDKNRDILFQAKKPGKRKTAWGSTYYENRANRSDKGVLLGLHNKRIVSGLPSYKDPDMARELELYADNDSLLYFQRRKPILINLSKKYKKGTYDVQKAAKLWRYYIDAALEKYNKEFGSRGDKWYDLMSVPDRNLLALEYAQNTKDEFDLGNFTEK